MRHSSPRPLALCRGLAVCVALGALVATAACTDVNPSPGVTAAPPLPVDPSPVDPAAAASADAVLAGDTKEICAQAERVRGSFGKTFIADLKLKIDVAGQGDDAQRQAAEKISRDVQNYSYALAGMAELTADAALKKALTDMSAQVKALKGDLSTINSDRMSQLTARLDQACGRG